MASADEPPEDFILPSNYVNIPLEALNHSARKQTSLYLNLEGTLNDDTGLLNNYQGLAEKIGFSYLEISNFELQKSPTEHVLSEWTTRKELSPTIGSFWEYLTDLQRYDVLTDIWKLIKRDCDKYLAMKAKFNSKKNPIQDQTVSQSVSEKTVDEGRILAVQDVGSETPTIYDAFVCYNPEGADLDFVRLLIEELEEKNNLTLFVPWRDDLPGASYNTVCAKLIEQRCKRMIIILSPQYLASSACEFQTKFAHGLSPGSRDKKLIPVLIEECVIPEILRHITCCNYTRKNLLDWFWKRLVKTLQAELNPSDCASTNQNSLSEISLDTSSEVFGWSSYSSTSGSYSSTSGSYASSGTLSSSDQDYLRPIETPPYLELLSSSPELPRRSNDYERISNIRQDRNKATSAAPIPPARTESTTLYTRSPNRSTPPSSITHSSGGTTNRKVQYTSSASPANSQRPVPPIPTEKTKRKENSREYFC